MTGTPLDFLDTNVLVYAFSTDSRSDAAEALLAKGCMVSVQGLNEFANVAKRKMGMGWDDVRDALSVIRRLCPIVAPVDVVTHDLAMTIAARHGFSVFDAVMLASACHAGCETIWTEDMRDGQVVEGRLQIRNPFV